MRFLTSLLLICWSTALFAVEESARQASSDEACLFVLANTYRADLRLGDSLVTAALTQKVLSGSRVAWSAALHERGENSMPPLLWNESLAAVARASLARFNPGGDGDPHDVGPDLKQTGYSGSVSTTLLLGESQGGLRQAFYEALSHCIERVKLNRGDRMACSRRHFCSATATSCGIAVEKRGAGYRVALVIDALPLGRAATVMVYSDVNRNRLLDQGEPLLPFTRIAAGARAPGNWPAGPVTIPLSDNELLTVESGDFSYPIPLQPEVPRMMIALAAADKTDVSQARKLLEAITKSPADPELPPKAAFDLHAAAVRMALDQATSDQVIRATSGVELLIAKARKDLINAIGEDPKSAYKCISTHQSRWQGRGMAWCTFAKSYCKAQQEFALWSAQSLDAKSKTAPALLKSLRTLETVQADVVLWNQIRNWLMEIEPCLTENRPLPTPKQK